MLSQFCGPRRGGNSDFALTIWRFWISDGMFCYWFKNLLMTAQIQSFARRVCARSRVWERETWSHNHDLCANTYKLHHCVCHVTLFQFRPWTDGKNKDNNNCLYIYFKAKSRDYGKGHKVTFPNHACGVRPITMHCVNWPIRADCACWREGICRKLSVWERRGIEDLQ